MRAREAPHGGVDARGHHAAERGAHGGHKALAVLRPEGRHGEVSDARRLEREADEKAGARGVVGERHGDEHRRRRAARGHLDAVGEVGAHDQRRRLGELQEPNRGREHAAEFVRGTHEGAVVGQPAVAARGVAATAVEGVPHERAELGERTVVRRKQHTRDPLEGLREVADHGRLGPRRERAPREDGVHGGQRSALVAHAHGAVEVDERAERVEARGVLFEAPTLEEQRLRAHVV